MATGTVVSIIGTAVTLLGFLLDNVPDSDAGKATLNFYIANDGAGDPPLTDAGGDLPDVRLWDETIEFLGINADPGFCEEGATTCKVEVSTEEAPTYALFTGNNDAICIAWTSITFPGPGQKYGWHPGNWAYGCDLYGVGAGAWYYAQTVVPGLEDSQDDVYCAWLDADGDIETTAFQVHWPEFNRFQEGQDPEDISYYCENDPPMNFRTDQDPSSVIFWPTKKGKRDLFTPQSKAEKKRGTERQVSRISKRLASSTDIVKSHWPKHSAAKLCDPSLHAAGKSFVSYAEKAFCYMPTKTLYPFCDTVEDGACFADGNNTVVVKGAANARVAIPDLGHVTNSVIWGPGV